MGRRQRVLAVAGLVIISWIGGCAPVLGVTLTRGVAHPGPGAPRPVPKARAAGLGLGARAGEIVETLTDRRRYVLHVPTDLTARPRPLVIALHGMYLSWQNMAGASDLSAYGDTHGFLVAYGVGRAASWNVGNGCCTGAHAAPADDVGYLTRVVADVAARVPVDRSRVYLVGFSLGDMLALYAQCERPDVFAASAGSSGALLSPCRAGAPLRYLHLHGRHDVTVPYGGGRSDALRRDVPAAAAFAGLLRDADPDAEVVIRTLPCAHAWATRRGPCHLDATDLIWHWMSRYRRQQAG
jgi:dienelactone hydrolase